MGKAKKNENTKSCYLSKRRGEEGFREEGEMAQKNREEGERTQKNRETGEPA